MRFSLTLLSIFCWVLFTLPGGAAGVRPLVHDEFHTNGTVNVTIPLANGQILIGGDFETVNGVRQPHAAKLNADGTLDQSWRPDVPEVNEMAVVEDEVYFLTLFLPLIRAHVSGDGQVDPDWNADTSGNRNSFVRMAVSGGFVYALKVQYNRDYTHSIVSLRRFFRAGNGKLDSSWVANLKAINPYFLAILADQTHVYVAHTETRRGGLVPTLIDRFPVAGRGKRDPSWRVATAKGGTLNGIAQDDDYIYGAGSALAFASGGDVRADRFSKSNAKSDKKWPADTIAFQASWSDVAVADGSAYFVGSTDLAGVPTGATNPDGSPSFSVAIQQDTYVHVSAGNGAVFLQAGENTTTQDRLLRVDRANGVFDQNFKPQIFREATVYQVLRLPSGVIYVAGAFDTVGDVRTPNLARFNPDGTLDSSWISPVNRFFPVSKISVTGDSIYAATTFDDIYRISLSAPARISSTWQPRAKLDVSLPSGENSMISQIAFGDDAVFFTYDRRDAQTSSLVSSRLQRVALGGDGSADPAWNVKLSSLITGFVRSGNYLYIAGLGAKVGSVQRYALDGGGVRDTTWGINNVYPMVIGADVDFLYVADFLSDIHRYSVAGAGAIDPAWNVRVTPRTSLSAADAISSILSAGRSIYISGDFSAVNDLAVQGIARLNGSGEPDSVFAGNVPFLEGTTGPLWIGAIADNPVLGGTFNEVDSAPAFPPSLFNLLPPPVLTRSGAKVFADSPNAESLGIQFFRLTALQGGTLASSGVPIAVGDSISLSAARAGLDFTPDVAAQGVRSLSLVSAVSAADEDTGTSASTIDLTDTLPPRNQYRMAVASLTVREGDASAMITVQKKGSLAGAVTFLIEEAAARLGTNITAPAVLTLDFPAGDGTSSIVVPLIDDVVFTGNKDFRVVLTGTSDGGIILSPSATQVTILDDDPIGDTNSLTTRPPLVAPPARNAALSVTFNAPLGAWHLLGEAGWHASGETLSGLTRGNYFVQFKPANGFIAPPARTVPVDFAESVSIAGSYQPLDGTTVGALSVSIEPTSVATESGDALGQWQIAGENTWHDSGETVEGLSGGPYDVVFKQVAGRRTPPPQTVNVAGAVLYSVTGTYLIADAASGTQPQPVDFATQQTSPYAFVGQIRTPVGFATGTAVRGHVVLTVAHALFDDVTLSAVTDARWYQEKAQGEFEPPPQGARGWYIFDGYASQRATDLEDGSGGVGISTPASQQLDVAAMWFLEPCARGSFSGYLRTDAENDWLLAARRRILAGYPIDEVPAGQRGKLHATDPGIPSSFTAVNSVIRATNDLAGSSGMSGGPLFVEQNSDFFPAGIFLGGTAQSLVRVIDTDVVDLINRGEVSGNGGDNNVGGGITLVSPGITSSPFTPTLLSCTLSPAGALAEGAAWRIAGEATYRKSGVRVAVNPGTYRLEFKPVAGFVAPDSQVLQLVEGQVATARNTYVPGVHITAVASPANAGTVNSKDFPLGQTGSLSARPAPNFLFSAWTENGQVISRSAAFTFDVNGPRQFTAVFVEGSFVPYAGTYAGLHQTGGVMDGLSSFKVTSTGAFSGTISYRGRTYKVRGTLNSDGTYSGPLGPYPFLMTIDRTSPVGTLNGQIFDGSAPTTFSATQSPYTTANPTALLGDYTLLLPSSDSTGTSQPPGTGYASLRITQAGGVTFLGKLADGATISGGGSLTAGDLLPLYAASYGGGGGIAGLLQFRNNPGVSDGDGTLTWVRPPQRPDGFFPGGFTTGISAISSKYSAPPVTYAGAILSLVGGPFASALNLPITIATPAFTARSTSDKSLRVTINAKRGTFTGSLNDPTTGKKVSLEGAIFQKTSVASGFTQENGQPSGSAGWVPN